MADSSNNGEQVKDNVEVINAVDIDPLKDVANMTQVTMEGKHREEALSKKTVWSPQSYLPCLE